MTVAFRVVYSLAVAILYILFVVFGQRTLYSEPDYPRYPDPVPPISRNIYCNPDGCYIDQTPITPAIEETLSSSEQEYLQDQREYQEDVEDYENDREDYFRNVFIIAGFWGVIAIAAAVALYRRVEAMPLGLLMGGIGALIYGWVEWSRGPDEAGTSVLFVIITLGLIAALAGGYFFLSDRPPKPEPPKQD